MVVIISKNKRIEIDDHSSDLSIFIRGARSFSITTTGRNEVDMTGFDEERVTNYIDYLNDRKFTMDDNDFLFFYQMGHIPETDVDTKTWKLILKNRYLAYHRDRLEGVERLIDIDIINDKKLSMSGRDCLIVGDIPLLLVGAISIQNGPLSSITVYSDTSVTSALTTIANNHMGHGKRMEVDHHQRNGRSVSSIIHSLPQPQVAALYDWEESEYKVYMSRLTHHYLRENIGSHRDIYVHYQDNQYLDWSRCKC